MKKKDRENVSDMLGGYNMSVGLDDFYFRLLKLGWAVTNPPSRVGIPTVLTVLAST